MILAFVLLTIGILLSALFSGSETGFYRATRVRWVLDGQSGDRLSRLLVWWANNPSVFVANILIGNNVANYLVSLAVVMAVKETYFADSVWMEFSAPLLLTPFLFVYGESLPKNLFLQAPNRLIRYFAPVLGLFNILFAPAAMILWWLNRVLEYFLGRSPERIRSRLARKELINVFKEGTHAGLLEPVQLQLAQNFFDLVDQNVDPIVIPTARIISVPEDSTVEKVLQLASRYRLTHVPVKNKANDLIGYVDIGEVLMLDSGEAIRHFRPFTILNRDDSVGRALIKMRSEQADLGLILDDQDRTRGMVAVQRLNEQLYTGRLVRWKR